MNLSGEPAEIPLGDAGRVLASWQPTEPPGPDGVLRLPPESCVVLADG